MSFKLHLILAGKLFVFIQIRCNFPDISYLSEMQKNNFQFLIKTKRYTKSLAIRHSNCMYFSIDCMILY